MNEIPKANVEDNNEGKQVVSLESIMQTSKDLKAKIEEAKRHKEENLNKQLSEREALLAELKQNEDLISETKKGLDEFDNLTNEELDILDESTKQELIKFRELLIFLTEQSKKITDKLHSMETNPEIFSKLHEEATTEDRNINAEQHEKEAIEKLNHQLEEFVSELVKYRNSKRELFEARDRYNNSKYAMRNSLDAARTNLKDVWRNGLDSISNQISSLLPDELKKRLTDLKSEMKITDFKAKKAIDSVLTNEKLFQEYQQSMDDRDELKKNTNNKKKELAEKYREIQNNIKDEEEKLNVLKEKEPGKRGLISSRMESREWKLLRDNSFQDYDIKEILDDKEIE
jgi:hypothetical protein